MSEIDAMPEPWLKKANQWSIDHKPLVDLVSSAVQLLLVLVAALALYAAFTANENAREANRVSVMALKNSFIPWVKIDTISHLAVEEGKVFPVQYSIKNFSQIPAFNITSDVQIIHPQLEVKKGARATSMPILMPQDLIRQRKQFVVDDPNAFAAAYLRGLLNIQLTLEYDDIFGRRYQFYAKTKFNATTGNYELIEGRFSGLDSVLPAVR